MMSMNLSNIASLNIHDTDYRCIISGISKSEGVHLLQKADLKEKNMNINLIKSSFFHIKRVKKF